MALLVTRAGSTAWISCTECGAGLVASLAAVAVSRRLVERIGDGHAETCPGRLAAAS